MVLDSCNLPILKKNIPLAGFTTYRIGGSASFFAEPETVADLMAVLGWARANGVDWFIIGGGSNILIADDGFPGLVIKLGRSFQAYSIDEENGIVTAGAATLLPLLGRDLLRKGWDGFIFMCVIPGTVGGAVSMNAGTTNEGEIRDQFLSADVLTEDLVVKSLSSYDLNFDYRYSSILKSRNIILSAKFKLEKQVGNDFLEMKLAKVSRKRKSVQPSVARNCGSVFKKPSSGESAGWYIERAGLKGHRIGDAQVAPEHANWIVNLNNAKAADVKNLIMLCQNLVYEKFDVRLEREVIILPDDIK